MRKFYRAIALPVALCTTIICSAQNSDLGSWNVANIRLNLNKQWSAWTEMQTRSYNIYDQFYYHELKGGFQFNINSSASALLGAGQYATYTRGGNFKSPVVAHEFRFWQQLTLTNNIDRLKLEHRYRIEQRWLTSGYRNRYRYRLSALVPINNKKMAPKTVYFNMFDEIFLTNTKPHFERNRFYVGAGYQFSNAFTLQLGALKQYDYKATGIGSSLTFFQTSLFFMFNLKKKEVPKEQHPGAVD